MARALLSDTQWARIEAMLPGKASDSGVTAADNRQFIEAVLWIARTGSPWPLLQDLIRVNISRQWNHYEEIQSCKVFKTIEVIKRFTFSETFAVY